MQKVIFLTFCLLIPLTMKAQFSPERLAVSRMQKGKWKSAEESLRKALRKDSINCEAKFIFATFYAAPANPTSNIDSAYRYSLLALYDFSRSSLREREKLRRFPIDSQRLNDQRKRIDSAAFERAKRINTENAYIDFLSRFTLAAERSAAIELRDEVAFVEALKINTYKSFNNYLTRYPASSRAGEARQRYEKLLYADRTRDGNLKSYESFWNEYPKSAYRPEAEKNIFEIITASGKPSSLTYFLKRYPSSRFKSTAQAILYHIVKDEEKVQDHLSDSLQEIQRLEKGFLVPILRNGKFGFIDQLGNETVRPQFDSIPHGYLCGNIRPDFLVVSGGIINRAGTWIAKARLIDVQDLGAGFLKVRSGLCVRSIHKSGRDLTAGCYEDVKLIVRNFLAFRDHGRWGLRSLAGRILFVPQFDEIETLDSLILFVKTGKKTLVTINQVAATANKGPLPTSLVFDDVRWLAKGNYWVKNGPLEGVLNAKLEFNVPFDRQAIVKSAVGFILEQNKKFRLSGVSPILENREFEYVLFYGKWIKLQEKGILQLYNIEKNRMEDTGLDSLSFEHELAFAFKHDSLRVYLNANRSVGFSSDTDVRFMKSFGDASYFFIPEKNKKAVMNAKTGERLFSIEADEVEYAGHSIFLVSKGAKRGLVNHTGKMLLPVEFAAIVPFGKDWVSLLKDKKFGMYNLSNHKLVKPVYDRNVNPFSSDLLIAYKDGAYGFIGSDAKPRSAFEFEEVRPWNDTAALVKKNFMWMIYAVARKRMVISNIKEYHYVQDLPQEKIALVRRDAYYGVISNTRGELIPCNFNDIVNVGSAEDPMYFSEKNVEEAGIHVVIYYDKNGKLLRKQVYEENEEYEKIYCEEN